MKETVLNKEDILALHSLGKSTTHISRFFHTSNKRVRLILKDAGVDENIYKITPKKYSDDFIKKVGKLYEDGKSLTFISKELKTYKECVKRIVKENSFERSFKMPEGFCKCAKCKVIKENTFFGKSGTSASGFKSYCKECRRKESSRKEYLKQWRENNRELKAQLDREYRLKNPDKIKASRSTEQYRKRKAETDKQYRLRCANIPSKKMAWRLRSMISSAVKNKNFKTFKLLGYTSNDLVKHLEGLFTNGMTWDNYGKNGWHIDHKKPLVLFDLEDQNQIKEAFSLENLQPLWGSENCSKGSLYNGKRHKKTTEHKSVA